jgi:hypothetical protein
MVNESGLNIGLICLHAQVAREIPVIPVGQTPAASSIAKSHRLFPQDVDPREPVPAPLTHPLASTWLLFD